MSNDHSKNARLIAVFFLGVLLLTYPILTLFNHSILLFGIPLLFLYLFAVGGGLIGLIGLIVRGALRNRQMGAGKGR